MSGKVLGGFFLIIFFLMSVFVYSFQYIAVADSDSQTGVTNAARNSMTEAINLGNVRVNEVVTINEEIAIESLLRMYSASSDFEDGARYVNVYDVKSDPAFIAAESYVSVGTPMKNLLNFYSKEKDTSNITGRSREIIIFEAKKITR